MSTIPEGNFTIVNNETGRAVRVRLGRTSDVSDHKEGTKYLQYVTGKPTLELGEADNSPATVWWHNGSEQIVSHAVGEYQNIGDHCVWLHASTEREMDDLFDTNRAFTNRLDDMPADLRDRLAPLIPAEWPTIQERRRAERDSQPWIQAREKGRAGAEAELEAWAAEDNPPSATDLTVLRAYRLGIAEETGLTLAEMKELSQMSDYEQQRMMRTYSPAKQEALRKGIDKQMMEVVERLERDPRAHQVRVRASNLLPEILERRAAAQAATPHNNLHAWHSQCAYRKVTGGAIRFTSPHYETDEDQRIAAALDTYLEAAAKEGIVPPVIAADSTTRVHGCGAIRYTGATYGWTYDGTYIYGADSKTVPSEQTYWTDADGYLVGRPKGGKGQTWSIVKWTPTPRPGTDVSEAALTGLFGPIGNMLGI
ncbi:hypothetical protein [Streptomyces sp. C]|uniref:hypothetical protein n=1 Tax=Streptomyces sp. C TaxID=253839 RepID=UPI0001B50927|nr:hypothetical protein [Streptomyces sp. C]